MKKVLIICIGCIAMLFSGCSRMTPSVASTVAQMYDTTKTILVKGQEIVIINSDLLPETTLAKLNAIDETLKTAKDIERVRKTVEVIAR